LIVSDAAQMPFCGERGRPSERRLIEKNQQKQIGRGICPRRFALADIAAGPPRPCKLRGMRVFLAKLAAGDGKS
jgi:hypothetical protein